MKNTPKGQTIPQTVENLQQSIDRLKEFISSILPELPGAKQREARELFKL